MFIMNRVVRFMGMMDWRFGILGIGLSGLMARWGWHKNSLLKRVRYFV